MGEISSLDGKRISIDEAQVSALGSAVMFGTQAFERLRGFYDKENCLRIRAFSQHLDRCLGSAVTLFGSQLPADIKTKWRNWVTQAVKASEFREPYIHLGFGQFVRPGAMLERTQTGFGTFIYVSEAPPLYGDSVSLVSETKWPRPSGPLVKHKISGNYADLLLLKNRARENMPDRDPKRVECVLYDQLSFGQGDIGANRMRDNSAIVAELGCSNVISTCGHNLHLPYKQVAYFCGISVQIVEALFRAIFKNRNVYYDLRRHHLLDSSGAIGTATRDLIPVTEMDGETVTTDETLKQLAAAYRDLCHGESIFPELQEKWAPVTE